MRAWQAAGVSLPHFAAAQYADIAHVAIADLQPGDLVFFGSDLHHVGIYAGGGTDDRRPLHRHRRALRLDLLGRPESAAAGPARRSAAAP